MAQGTINMAGGRGGVTPMTFGIGKGWKYLQYELDL